MLAMMQMGEGMTPLNWADIGGALVVGWIIALIAAFVELHPIAA